MERILIVDGDQDLLMLLEYTFEAAGFSTATAWSREEALRMSVQQSFDLILIGEHLGCIDSAMFEVELRLLQPESVLRLIHVRGCRSGKRFDSPEAEGCAWERNEVEARIRACLLT